MDSIICLVSPLLVNIFIYFSIANDTVSNILIHVSKYLFKYFPLLNPCCVKGYIHLKFDTFDTFKFLYVPLHQLGIALLSDQLESQPLIDSKVKGSVFLCETFTSRAF